MSDRSQEGTPDGETGYNNLHRAFLQSFLSHSVLTIDEIKPILAAVYTAHERRPTLEGDITPADISNVIHTVNTRLSPLDLEIRTTRSQSGPRTQIFALINTTSDALTQLATTRTADEIAYIKRLLDDMFEFQPGAKEGFVVEKTRAAQLAKVRAGGRPSGAGVVWNGTGYVAETPEDGDGENTQTQNVKSLTLDAAEHVLKCLVQEQWFIRCPENRSYYTLAPRALLELRTWLKETYNETAEDVAEGEEPAVRVRDCEGCREIVTMGVRCRERNCGVRMHEHCTQVAFRGQGDQRKCPRCKAEWTGEDFVGVKAVMGSRGRPSGAGEASNRRRRVEDEEDDDI